MKLRPLDDRIVVRRLEGKAKTPGGIVLPDTAKEKANRGTVVAVGIGKLLKNGRRAPLQVKKGDQVVFSSFDGDEVNIEGQEYLILSESDILASVN